jgi:hypothetical protein
MNRAALLDGLYLAAALAPFERDDAGAHSLRFTLARGDAARIFKKEPLQ